VDLVRTLLVLAAFLLTAAPASAAAILPADVQAKLAYAPTWVPPGFAYRTWKTDGDTTYVWFRDRHGWEITFVVAPNARGCASGMEQKFGQAYWSHTFEEQQAWRCVGKVRIVAATPQPLYRVTDRALARIVATAKRVKERELESASVPIPRPALLKIDRAASYRNFLPTLTIGFTYSGWSYRNGVLRVEFENKRGQTFEWRVLPMKGTCDAGKQQSFQLGGNKVWWAQAGPEQRAWRCAFDLAGKPVRLEAASTQPIGKLAPAGLGIVAAHAKRY
jgi:hypothetical protein